MLDHLNIACYLVVELLLLIVISVFCICARLGVFIVLTTCGLLGLFEFTNGYCNEEWVIYNVT